MLTKCAALELGGFGIRVNAVAPGFVNTETRLAKGDACMKLSEADNNSLMSRIASETPLAKQVTSPECVAESALWLASDDASYITGEILTMDGGLSLTTSFYKDNMMDLVFVEYNSY
jgi:3-oxoacyl-[acyl-carrier protein] reductase